MPNTPEYRQMMSEAIRKYKEDNPGAFADLQRRAKDASYDSQVLLKKMVDLEKNRREMEFERLNKPVIAGLPDIDMTGVRGLVAYKTWQFDGHLHSTAMSYWWRELNIADKVPSKDNPSGFYCVKLSSLGVITTGSSYFNSYALRSVSGFVELSGTVIEHYDGVLRAEIAKLLCLFVVANNPRVEHIVRSLYENYITPVYVLNPEQLADVLFREVLRQKYLGI